jgi:hypothetical protein
MEKQGPRPTSVRCCDSRAGVHSLSSAPVTSSNESGVPPVDDDDAGGEMPTCSDVGKVDPREVTATMYGLMLCGIDSTLDAGEMVTLVSACGFNAAHCLNTT